MLSLDNALGIGLVLDQKSFEWPWVGVFSEGTMDYSELTWYRASWQEDKLPKLRGHLGQNLEDGDHYL